MAKKIPLSPKGIKEWQKDLEKQISAIKRGTSIGVEEATKMFYTAVLKNCDKITSPESDIHYDYDANKNIGTVYTDSLKIIFNEMGTGIVGSNNPHPMLEGWEYDVNEHGEEGWLYPKEDGTFGWTKGLPARKMFYDAWQEIQPLIADTITISIEKLRKDLY